MQRLAFALPSTLPAACGPCFRPAIDPPGGHLAALVYASTCLSKGSRVTLTIESVTALRNLRAAPADAEAQQEGAAQGGAAEQTPQRDGAARPARPGQRQQTAETQPATRPQERAGGGRAEDEHTAELRESSRICKDDAATVDADADTDADADATSVRPCHPPASVSVWG